MECFNIKFKFLFFIKGLLILVDDILKRMIIYIYNINRYNVVIILDILVIKSL